MPASAGYTEYQIVQTGNEPDPKGWKEYEAGMKPTESYAYEYPIPGGLISFTLYLRDGEGNVKESVATITSRNNFQGDIAFKPDETFADVSGTALVPSGSTATIYYGADKNNLDGSIEMGVGANGSFSGTIGGLEPRTTYYWDIEICEGSRLSGTGSGKFTTLYMIQHGDAAEIGAPFFCLKDNRWQITNGAGGGSPSAVFILTFCLFRPAFGQRVLG